MNQVLNSICSWLKLIFVSVLCVLVSFFCACFSLGVEDMDEYNALFPYVYAIKQDFSYEKKDMSDFVGEEDASTDLSSAEDSSSDSSSDEERDMSELTAVVPVDNYCAIAIEVAAGTDSQSSSTFTTTIGEIALYFYYEGMDDADDEEEVILSYGIYVSATLPGSSFLSISDITGSTESDLYEDNEIVMPFSEDDMLISGNVTLTEGWSTIYDSFSTNPVISSGSYLVIVFYENCDYRVSFTETTTTNPNTGDDETTYSYTFGKYTDNDIAFSFDKTLLYVVKE